jgi:hypothetical protein
LFSAAVSSGMLGVLEEPCVGRSVISTVAVAPFCSTLTGNQCEPGGRSLRFEVQVQDRAMLTGGSS